MGPSALRAIAFLAGLLGFRAAEVLEPILWRTFVPPAIHRLHHAPNREDTDSNFGTILTLWDSVLGTFSRRAAGEEPSFGIPGMRDPSVLSLGALAVLPFRRSVEG